ncbi:MAG TPA: LCP family protein [Thermoleophilaceae bacterium]|nr:LCP family protein [Thermoleophilaceae bacterium]
MSDPNPGGPPDYKVYRSRKRPLQRLSGGTDLNALKRRLSRARNEEPSPSGERGRITPGRVLKWIALAILGWLLLSLVLFLISAQMQDGVSPQAERALSDDGNLLTGSTILVLGSDARTGESIDESQSGPSRADSIMLVHAALGSVRKLSIPRDIEVEIPGHGTNKVNAAYALGGPALTIETIEGFLGNGLQISHLVEVDFEDFPELIDSLGGVTVQNKTRICAPPFDNFWKGFRLRKGEQELNGTRALGYARVRKNPCAPAEDDRDRAARQQEVLRAIGDAATSPGAFLRLPLVSWRAPKALKTDMKGPALMALFADMATGNSDETAVLEAGCCVNGSNLFVSDGAKRDAVDTLLNGS